MAKYVIDSVNYVTAGKTEKILNLDISLPDDSNVLGVEGHQELAIVAEGSSPSFFSIYENVTQQHVQLKNQTFVCDIDENRGTFGSVNGTNRTGFKVLGKDVIVHSLYNINDIAIKSKIQKVKDDSAAIVDISQKNSTEYLDIYAPDLSDNIIGICQLKDCSYCLTDRMTIGPSTLKTDLRDQRAVNGPETIKNTFYSWKIDSHDLPTYFYNTTDTLADTSQLSSFFIPRYNLAGIKYNYMIEIPQSFSIYNDYEAGDMFGEIMQAKNAYDSSYSMNVISTDSDIRCLSSAREYCGIDVCGNKVFLKFYDNVNYMFSCPTSTKKSYNSLESIGAAEAIQKTYPYQKIETLDGINKFRANVKHKSNMFSININNTRIDQLDTGNAESTQKLKEKIKSDIRNQVRTLSKKFCPADTCLFDVYFDGGQ